MEPNDVAAMKGGDVMIHCKAEGFPQPVVTWMQAKGIVL